MACSVITFFASSPETPMWFITIARSLRPGPITAKRASYRLCFSASRGSIGARGVFCRCGNVCRRIYGEHSNVLDGVYRTGRRGPADRMECSRDCAAHE